MTEKSQLAKEIENLPQKHLQEIARFIEYLKFRKSKNITESMFFAESSLAKDWSTPEEDEAWASL